MTSIRSPPVLLVNNLSWLVSVKFRANEIEFFPFLRLSAVLIIFMKADILLNYPPWFNVYDLKSFTKNTNKRKYRYHIVRHYILTTWLLSLLLTELKILNLFHYHDLHSLSNHVIVIMQLRNCAVYLADGMIRQIDGDLTRT